MSTGNGPALHMAYWKVRGPLSVTWIEPLFERSVTSDSPSRGKGASSRGNSRAEMWKLSDKETSANKRIVIMHLFPICTVFMALLIFIYPYSGSDGTRRDRFSIEPVEGLCRRRWSGLTNL